MCHIMWQRLLKAILASRSDHYTKCVLSCVKWREFWFFFFFLRPHLLISFMWMDLLFSFTHRLNNVEKPKVDGIAAAGFRCVNFNLLCATEYNSQTEWVSKWLVCSLRLRMNGTECSKQTMFTVLVLIRFQYFPFRTSFASGSFIRYYKPVDGQNDQRI